MKNKIFIIVLFILTLFMSIYSVSAENIDNLTLTNGIDLDNDLSQQIVVDEVEMTGETQDNILEESDEISITPQNYNQYFNVYTGKFKSDVDSSKINTVKIGNVSNCIFAFEKKINIMPIDSSCQIKNGVVHLLPGSDGSTISGLKIINNDSVGDIKYGGILISRAHGIWFTNSSNNLIYNNTIIIGNQKGCYAMPMGYSNNNRILNNTIISGLTSCIVMGRCNYNNISNNYIEICGYELMTTSNLIFFNPWGHADYDGGGACCDGNYISNNYLKNFGTGEWAVSLSLGYYSGDTKVINNTIIRGSVGVEVIDMFYTQPRNILIKDNVIIDCPVGIFSGSNNVTIDGNKIYGDSESAGIYIQSNDALGFCHNVTISNNYFEFDDVDGAIIAHTENATILNNEIHLSRYGRGIIISPTNYPVVASSNNCIISGNCIYNMGDDGISILGHNITISNNNIFTKSKGIVITSSGSKMYNASVIGNVIFSEDVGIHIDGFVINSTVMYNEIETNESEGIHFSPSGDLGDYFGIVSENTINGVIENTETLIINDTNFYDYFDKTGYLTYEFKPNSKRIIFFTFLTNKNVYFTDKIFLTSNKMSNLLYNVSIKLMGNASGSKIQDFKFYSLNKDSIILDNVNGVSVSNNEFTVSSNVLNSSVISVIGCENSTIINNDIFMSSKSNYAIAISVSNPANAIVKRLSKNVKISYNNILIKTTGVAKGIYVDSLVESDISKNNINIISDDSAYGLEIENGMIRPYNFTINSNLIVINSKEMSYLIKLGNLDISDIIDNYLVGSSNGVYGIGAFNSWDININRNEIFTSGKKLTDKPVSDELGKGNADIALKTSRVIGFTGNIFDLENSTTIIKDASSIIKNFNVNSYVIANYNYNSYFDSKNKLKSNLINDNSIILFKNFTANKIMDINIPVSIKPYKHLNDFTSTLILSENANKTSISGLKFNNAIIKLNGVSNVNIMDNTFSSSRIIDNAGLKNAILNNLFDFKLNNTNGIEFESSIGGIFKNNIILIDSKNSNFISVKNSNEIEIVNNTINATADSVIIINSISSNKTNVLDNTINISSKGIFNVYSASKSSFDRILNNNIYSKGVSNYAVIYYDSQSTGNDIEFNKIYSYSKDGKEYAVLFDTIESLSNTVANNYLISSNGYRRGNDAVYAIFELVCNNTPVTIYVSINSTEDGDGSFENPYSSIHQALNNSLSGAIIYILPGYYNESNLTIDKNITLTAINNDGSVYIDALNNRLFTITECGSLTVNALKIFNGFSVEGGSLFYNLGSLLINNSIIYNSSSYYDNSHPTFKATNIRTPTLSESYDCENLGLGGAILNYGELLINSSTFFDNFAHKGGVLADFGKSSIKNSLLFNNTGVHGGAIFTDSSCEFNIEDSYFFDNLAIQTLDYCYIQRESLYQGGSYHYNSLCDMRPGYGGAIFSNSSITILNSLFERNIAKSGGAIAHYSEFDDNSHQDGLDYYISDRSLDMVNFDYVPILKIENSVFRYNEAKDTSCGNLTMLADKSYEYYYSSNFNGGVIFGSLDQLNLLNSIFEHNIANTGGGALCVQCEDSIIEGCRFYNNTAGEYGGAIESFGTFKVFDTEILNNHAKNGGAIKYSSYTAYNHIQNIMNLFNVTIAGNRALSNGGAFFISNSNFAITNSNIYDNNAPYTQTFYGGGNIDARNNWWGSVDGPDDSVWNHVSRFRTWLSEKVTWNVPNVGGGILTIAAQAMETIIMEAVHLFLRMFQQVQEFIPVQH